MKRSVVWVAAAMFASVAMVFAQEAQNEKVLHEQEISHETANEPELQESAPEVVLKVEEPVVAKVEEKKEEKKSDYPKIKQSGGVFLTPRMEIVGYKNAADEKSDSKGNKVDNLPDANQRRLMFGWGYKLNVAVNEKLDLNFRLSDPEAEAGTTIPGSTAGSSLKNMLNVMLPNAYFTWKPAKVFNLSGGLLDFGGYSAIDLETSWEQKNPSKAYNNTYWNSLAGFNFSFPVAPAARIFLTAGIVDRTLYQTALYADNPADTIKPYSDGRIVLGADISLAEKKISLKPVFSIKTRGDTISVVKVKDETTGETKDTKRVNSDKKPVIAEGIDMGFKIAKPFSLNASVSAVQDYQNDSTAKYNIIGAGVEPVLTFGGENGKLFTFRLKYAFDVASNGGDKAVKANLTDATLTKMDGSSFTNHIDTRFSIAVNDKMSIAPRWRYWGNNGLSWYQRALVDYRTVEKDGDGNQTGKYVSSDENKSARSLSRFELAFTASF